MWKAFLCILLLAAAAMGGIDLWRRYEASRPAYERAHWKMMKGDYHAAVQLLNQAREEDPGNLRIVVDLADCFDRMGDKKTAALLLREARPLLYADDNPPGGVKLMRDRFEMLVSLGY